MLLFVLFWMVAILISNNVIVPELYKGDFFTLAVTIANKYYIGLGNGWVRGQKFWHESYSICRVLCSLTYGYKRYALHIARL